MFAEEIFNSLHQRTAEKDSNNNSTITAKAKMNVSEKSVTEGVLRERKNVAKNDSNLGVQTLKRKRDSKSPTSKTVLESPSSDATSRKQSQTTATILVSKTKTKTGLPLLLKK